MSKQTRHILVIDDNAEDRAAIRWYLEQDADFAYAIQEAELGSQGIAAYASVRPDCVLLDYRLPDMDGLEVLSVLTEGKIPPDIAIVMLTGTGNEAIAVQALRRGAHDYLVKGKAVSEDIRRAVSNAIEKVELVGRINEQRKWLQGTLASIGDAVIATDVAGCVTFMNEVAQGLTGWTQTDAEGQHIAEVFRIVNEETRSTVESSVEQTLREGVIVGPVNHTLLAKDGREVPIDHSVAPVHDQTGTLLGAVRVFRDISARKQTEEQLRRNHETFYNLIQNTPFGVFIVDADFRLVQISKGSKKVFNNVASPIGRDFAEILRTLWKEPFATQVIERFRHTFLTGEPYRSSNTTEQRGDIEDVESYDWKIERITLPDGRYGVVCYFYDLTERLQFEKKLRESEERIRLVLGASQLGIWIYDFTTQRVYRSAEHDEIFGTDKLEPTADAFFSVVHPEDVERVQTEFNRSVEMRSLFEIEFRIMRPDGEERWIKNQGHAKYDADGQPLQFLGTVFDITGRRRRELNLAFLADLQRALGGLLSAAKILSVAGTRITRYLNLSHCLFVEIGEDADEAYVIYDHHAAGATSLAGIYPLQEFYTQAEREQLAAGQLLVINDVRNDSHLEAGAARLDALGVCALANAPYSSDGRWKFLLSAQHDQPHQWREDEIELLRELSAQIWLRLERINAEEALRENEKQLALALTSAAMGVWTWDLRTNAVHWSPEHYTIFGLDSFDGTLEAFAKTLHPEDAEHVLATVNGAIESRLPYEAEFRIIRGDGTVRWVGNRGRAEYDADGKPLRMLGIAADIHERKQVEEKLRESEQQLRKALNTIKREQRQLQTILASLPVGVMVTDKEGAALMLNQALNDIWRGTRTVESLNHCEHYQAWELDTNKRFNVEDWPISRTLKTGEPQAEREFGIRRFDDTTGIMSAVAVPLKDEEGALIGGVSVAQDITERKRAEAERTRLLASEQRLRAAAEEANRLKDEFLATASHELRTPLTAIVGWARMLRSGKLDPETTSQALGTIERNANVQTKLIEDLLDISRILSGKLLLDIRPLQMSSVISDAVNTVSPAAHAKNIAIEVSIDPLADSVPGDANRLQQVIWNLLSNAVKFTPKDGFVMVALRRVDGQIEITVRDTGLGIEPEFLPYVFDRFRQADGKTTKKHGGLGLGLAIVRHLVELHGGEVKAHSDGLGSGSSFIVSLPLVDENASTASRATPPVKVETIVDTRLTIECPPKLNGLRVLVVDDDWDTLEMLSAVLGECDAEVVTVASAAEAILEIERRRPDVLVSDIGMPDEDGYDLIRWVRETEEERGEHAIPALALTAYAKASDRVRALAAGYQVHLAKPVEPAELALVVANLAGRINVSG